ncbi:MAG: GAF and ANTAR domain-containing protein [Candidatus Omnitrophica bacterium]|nr:GAF and ANTAR domain-containing protein [Candidatus Omnitrophota bacterium]
MAKRKKEEAIDTNKIEAFTTISKAITSDLYLEDILKLIVTVTAKVMGSKICSLMLLDEEKQALVIRATQSVSEAYNKKPNIKIGEGAAGRVFKENRPMVIVDVKKDPLYLNKEVAIKEKLCSLLSVPLNIRNKPIGVINLYTSKPHKFTDAEIKVLTAVANQAAVAIKNAELITKTKIIQEELESRKLIERAKDILMKELGISGEDAYKKIQKQSMDTRRAMREIAEAVILARELKNT